MTAAMVPASADAGGSIQISWKVNNGCGDSPASVNLIRLVGQGVDVSIGSHNNAALAPGASSHSHGKDVSIPQCLVSGAYQVVVQVDPDNEIIETDETDNEVGQSIQVQC